MSVSAVDLSWVGAAIRHGVAWVFLGDGATTRPTSWTGGHHIRPTERAPGHFPLVSIPPQSSHVLKFLSTPTHWARDAWGVVENLAPETVHFPLPFCLEFSSLFSFATACSEVLVFWSCFIEVYIPVFYHWWQTISKIPSFWFLWSSGLLFLSIFLMFLFHLVPYWLFPFGNKVLFQEETLTEIWGWPPEKTILVTLSFVDEAMGYMGQASEWQLAERIIISLGRRGFTRGYYKACRISSAWDLIATQSETVAIREPPGSH